MASAKRCIFFLFEKQPLDKKVLSEKFWRLKEEKEEVKNINFKS